MGDFVFVSGPAGCEHTDDHGRRAWGTRNARNESRGTREKLFDLGHGHSMGGDLEPWRLGAWAAAHETIPPSCLGSHV